MYIHVQKFNVSFTNKVISFEQNGPWSTILIKVLQKLKDFQ